MFASDLSTNRPQLYAIVLDSGTYDSCDHEVVGISDDEHACNAYVDKMNGLRQRVEEKRQEQTLYMEQWKAANPAPSMRTNLETVSVPKLPGNRTPTEDERAAKQAAIDENTRRETQAYAPFLVWHTQYQEVANKWAQDNLTSEEIEIKNMDHPSWTVQNVDWFVPPVPAQQSVDPTLEVRDRTADA